MEKAIANFRNEVKVLRDKIENYLISLLETHDTNSVDCYVCEGCPVIIDGVTFDDDYSTYTLDRIVYNGVNSRVYCSNREDDDSFYITSLGIDTLTDLYEWLLENEEFMEFDND